MKLRVDSREGYEVSEEVEGCTEEYAMSFLAIFNNVRIHDELFRITNTSSNIVKVVCDSDFLEETKRFLSQFGKILCVDKVLCYSIEEDPEFDYDKYEDLVFIPYGL